MPRLSLSRVTNANLMFLIDTPGSLNLSDKTLAKAGSTGLHKRIPDSRPSRRRKLRNGAMAGKIQVAAVRQISRSIPRNFNRVVAFLPEIPRHCLTIAIDRE